MIFIIINYTVLSAASGVQAILELYFVNFLFVCSTRDGAEMLSTIAVNIFIAFMLFAALPGGVFGDYCLGNYCTQALNTVVATASLWLLLLSSWQFSVTKPSCCVDTFNTSSAVSLLNGSSGVNGGSLGVPGVMLGEELAAASVNHGNCSELARNILFPEVSLGLSPSLLMALCLTALAVSIDL